MLALCSFCQSMQAGAQATSGTDSISLVLQDVKLERLLTDRAELSAGFRVTAGTAAVLQDIQFRYFYLDAETPIYIGLLPGRFSLQRSVPFTLPRVTITAYYADLPAPTAMDAMLQAQRVRVTGEVRANLHLSLLGKLAVRERNPVAGMPIDEIVSFEDGSVDTTTQFGVGLLSLAQRALGASASILDRITGVRITSDSDAVSGRDTQSLVLVKTTYRLRAGSESFEKTCVRLGFWTDESHVMVPAEALEPWAYSIETAATLASGVARVDTSSIETVVFPFSATGRSVVQGWSQAHGDFTISLRGRPASTRLLLPGGAPVSVMEREDPRNFALLQFKSRTGIPVKRSGAIAADGPLRILRRSSGDEQRLHALVLGPSNNAATASLPRPLDEAAFGSPLVNNGTAVGMVAGERTVVPLPEMLSEEAGQFNTVPTVAPPQFAAVLQCSYNGSSP